MQEENFTGKIIKRTHIVDIDFTAKIGKQKPAGKTVENPKLVRAGAFHFQCNDNFNARGRHTTLTDSTQAAKLFPLIARSRYQICYER